MLLVDLGAWFSPRLWPLDGRLPLGQRDGRSSQAINSAQDLANSLNNATASVQNTRAAADKSIATQVDTLNSLLSQFETAILNLEIPESWA